MKVVLDTNILILLIKNRKFTDWYRKQYRDLSKNNDILTSSVVLGELNSIAKQNQWGKRRKKILEGILETVQVVDTNFEEVIDAYGDIDAYSQGKLKNRPLPVGMSARNMGKNDLWIAATTAALNAELLSTDKDFMHLDGVFFTFRYIDVEDFR